MSYLIKGATVVTAVDQYEADLAIEGEQIVAIGASLDSNGAKVIDAKGCYLFPGGIDPHTHFDMPFGGTITADDFTTGTRGALAGGTTTVIDFAMQQKGGSLHEAVQTWHEKAGGKALIDYAFHLGLADPRADAIAELPAMVDEGVTSAKLFLAYKGTMMATDEQIFETMQAAKKAGILVQAHCENGDVIDVLTREALARGETAPVFHARTRPSSLEGEATRRAITFAQLTGAPLYVVHVTCAEAAEAIAEGRRQGAPVWGETCPQYLLLDDTAYEGPGFEGAKYVMSPPLRKIHDQQMLWQAIATGNLQTIGSDHCSFCMEGTPEKPQKELGKENFFKIPNGAPGAEERFGLLYSFGVVGGRLSLQQFVDLVSTKAAKLFGLFPRKGTIAVGSDADLVLWDPSVKRTISAATQHQHVDYSAYEGFQVQGAPVKIFRRGSLAFDEGKILAQPGDGIFLHCNRFSEGA